jgi:site-specific recombinase
LRASRDRLRSDSSHRQALQAELRELLQSTRATHALTEEGLLSDETLVEGVLHRLGARLAPAPPRDAPLERALRGLLGPADRAWLAQVTVDDVADWAEALLASYEGDWEARPELNARGQEGVDWRAALRAWGALIRASPAAFFFPRADER